MLTSDFNGIIGAVCDSDRARKEDNCEESWDCGAR